MPNPTFTRPPGKPPVKPGKSVGAAAADAAIEKSKEVLLGKVVLPPPPKSKRK